MKSLHKTKSVGSLVLFTWALTYVHLTFASPTTPKGWKWYNELKAYPTAPKPVPTSLPSNTKTTVMSATQQMQWFHQAYEEVKADATINPQDEEKYLKLMQLNHFIGEKTAQTGMTFKKTASQVSRVLLRQRSPCGASREKYLSPTRAPKENRHGGQNEKRGLGLFLCL